MLSILENGPCVKAMVLLFTAELYRPNLWYNFYMKKVKGARNTDRQNGKASKKRPKMFDPIKRRLVTL
jgi:hypothetical protein